MTAFLRGNLVRLLRNGTEYFPALERAIDSACHEIYLQTYIFEADTIGRRVAAALARATSRGVVVNLLLDGFGCKDTPRSFIREMQESGIHILIYRPRISPWTLKRNRLRRLHCKVALIDGVAGFVGGINIIDDMNTPGHIPPRIDYAVQVEGPVVHDMQLYLRRLWKRLAWTRLRKVLPSREAVAVQPARGAIDAAFVVRDNLVHRRSIEVAYLEAIESAQQEIIIANAYFLPGKKFRKALVSAARRGVRVVLLLQARVEYVLLDYASRALYDEFLHAGIEIHEYHTSFMHSKVAVVDCRWSTVGSSNIDPFSLWLAREANIVVDDTGFAHLLREDLQRSILHEARRVGLDEWKHANPLRRSVALLTYASIRMILGLVGLPEKV